MEKIQKIKGFADLFPPDSTVFARIEDKRAEDGLAKYFAYGPMFRYERPQKGRMRQFHQIDVEAVGSPDALLDAEVLLMLDQYLRALGLANLTIELNSLGCKDCRPVFLDVLREFLKGMHKEHLCEDCMRRKLINPLRVLDCKVPTCKEYTADAPRITDHLCPECAEHFAVVRRVLDGAGLAYVLNPRLVRGLDYYVRTTFEIVSGDIGSQSSVAGGGRYDGLVHSIGGPDVPGVGFACGMERLALLIDKKAEPAPDFALVVLDATGLERGLLLAQELRAADKSGAAFCLVLGSDELAAGTVVVKNMRAGGQETVSQDLLPAHLRARLVAGQED